MTLMTRFHFSEWQEFLPGKGPSGTLALLESPQLLREARHLNQLTGDSVMKVYITPQIRAGRRYAAARMWSECEHTLHSLAHDIGIHPRWFRPEGDPPYYLVYPPIAERAVLKGAKRVKATWT